MGLCQASLNKLTLALDQQLLKLAHVLASSQTISPSRIARLARNPTSAFRNVEAFVEFPMP
jgi:hypothetical protein